jgi:hypothetical protein
MKQLEAMKLIAFDKRTFYSIMLDEKESKIVREV